MTLHLPGLAAGIRFKLCRFHSPLLAASLLISFPAPTKMFQSGAFPILTDQHLRAKRSHSEILGSKPPCGSPRLFATWYVLLQRLSRAIHRMVYLPEHASLHSVSVRVALIHGFIERDPGLRPAHLPFRNGITPMSALVVLSNPGF